MSSFKPERARTIKELLMNIGPYTFAAFKQSAADFHGYPAPGILLGGYMVEMARRALPEGTLFEALVETGKCLPDAVQLLTLCSTGNNRMKVLPLGRYALSLYDKSTGAGFRVYVDSRKIRAYPELSAWFLKLKPKEEQDTERLLRDIETAGEAVCSIMPVRIHSRFLGRAHSGGIALCLRCGEAFPSSDGAVCRACQGETPYAGLEPDLQAEPARTAAAPAVSVVPVEKAIGKTALHDMTEIIPGRFKGAAFSAGQTISADDVRRLRRMGKFTVAVQEGAPDGFAHENVGAAAFAGRMAGKHIEYSLPPQEGKINFRAAERGLFTLDRNRLFAFNLVPDVMCATRQDGSVVGAGEEVAGTRIIPLYISEQRLAEALEALDGPLFFIAPMRRARIGILVTGTEIFQGLVEDRFIPIVSAKVEQYGCSVIKTVIAPDDPALLRRGIAEIRAAGADLLITTGGMSVDPDDVTRTALIEEGIQDMMYGAPVLPGTMSLVGCIPAPGSGGPEPRPGDGAANPAQGAMQVMGIPACALYYKTTFFDALLPRVLAGRKFVRADMASFAEGGFCRHCETCAWPKCGFLK
jgi:formylmethanofuran dehydrogenase subunit E